MFPQDWVGLCHNLGPGPLIFPLHLVFLVRIIFSHHTRFVGQSVISQPLRQPQHSEQGESIILPGNFAPHVGNNEAAQMYSIIYEMDSAVRCIWNMLRLKVKGLHPNVCKSCLLKHTWCAHPNPLPFFVLCISISGGVLLRTGSWEILFALPCNLSLIVFLSDAILSNSLPQR